MFHLKSCTFRVMLQSTFKIVICTLACPQQRPPNPQTVLPSVDQRCAEMYWVRKKIQNTQHITAQLMSTSQLEMPWIATFYHYFDIHDIYTILYTVVIKMNSIHDTISFNRDLLILTNRYCPSIKKSVLQSPN